MNKLLSASFFLTFLFLVLFSTTSAQAFTFTRSLTTNSIGNDVSELQFLLTKEGFFKGTISGNYGVLTVNGVRKLQEKLGLKPDGSFGSQTITALNGGKVAGAYTDDKDYNNELQGKIGPGLNIKLGKVLFLGGMYGASNPGFTYLNDIYQTSNMYQWNLVSQDDPNTTTKWSQRSLMETLYYKNKYWIFGGSSTAGMLTDVWSSSDGINWTKSPTPAPFITGYGAYKVTIHDGKIFAVGTEDTGPNTKVWSSSDGTNWTVESAAPQFGFRYAGFSFIDFKGTLYLIGGLDISLQYKEDIWSSVDGQSWQLVSSPSGLGQRAYSTALVHNGQVFIISGQTPNGTQVSGDVMASSDMQTWTLLTTTAPGEGSVNDFIVAGGKMWTVNSAQPGFGHGLWSSVDGATWTAACVTLPFSGRSYHSMISNGGLMSSFTDPCSPPPPTVCSIIPDDFIVPQTTTISSRLTVPVSWKTEGCTGVTLQTTSGSYDLRYVGSANGSHTFSAPDSTQFSSTDQTLDVTIIAYNGTSIVSQTKSIQIEDVPKPTGLQCVINSFTASPNATSSSTRLSWSAEAGCTVVIDAWKNNTSGTASNSYVMNGGSPVFGATGSVSVSVSASTTYYLTAFADTGPGTRGNADVRNVKTVDVVRQ